MNEYNFAKKLILNICRGKICSVKQCLKACSVEKFLFIHTSPITFLHGIEFSPEDTEALLLQGPCIQHRTPVVLRTHIRGDIIP